MKHAPVLTKEVVELLDLKAGDNVIDCTLGDGGHAQLILEKTAENGKLLGIDADVESLLRAKRFLYSFEDRFVAVRDNFINLKEIVEKNNFKKIKGILIDLGWSSPQFEQRGRGFSFQNKDEELDMRFDVSSDQPTAAQIINSYSESELAEIFRRYGEEKCNIEIAKKIVESRDKKEIAKVGELAEIIAQVYRKKIGTSKEVPYIGKLHPATKVFQALRIEVNHELEVLKKVLPIAVEVLASQGRIAVISFHSLEDRIVKQYFKKISLDNKKFSLINKKPVVASDEEIKENPRSRSAKLRVIAKK